MRPDPETRGWLKTDGSGKLAACGETLAVVRKKVLLRILARRDADRTKIRVTDADVQTTSEEFCKNFGLMGEENLARWIQQQGLTESDYAKAMHDFTIVRLLEEAYAEEIDELVPNHIAISTARLRQK